MVCQQPDNNKSYELLFNNDGLNEMESSAEKCETLRLASIFGGTSRD
jgi:hypothetical protein